MKNLIKSTSFKIIFSLLIGYGIGILWDSITETEAVDYAVADLKKISETFDKTNKAVQYDYLNTPYSIDSGSLNSYINGLNSSSNVLVKFGFKKENNIYTQFGMALSSIDGKEISTKNFPLNKTKWSDDYSKNYAEAYKKVQKSTWFLNVIGHNKDNYVGVSFNKKMCLEFINKNKAATYYFYPVLYKPSGGIFDNSFTSVIITNKSDLRSIMDIEGLKYESSVFYGNHGQGCCP